MRTNPTLGIDLGAIVLSRVYRHYFYIRKSYGTRCLTEED